MLMFEWIAFARKISKFKTKSPIHQNVENLSSVNRSVSVDTGQGALEVVRRGVSPYEEGHIVDFP
jgi:hypothetical protein